MNERALELAKSQRGQYLLSRGLVALEKQLDAVKDIRHREESDLADVRCLIEEVFPMQRMIDEATKLGKEKADEQQSRLHVPQHE